MIRMMSFTKTPKIYIYLLAFASLMYYEHIVTNFITFKFVFENIQLKNKFNQKIVIYTLIKLN